MNRTYFFDKFYTFLKKSAQNDSDSIYFDEDLYNSGQIIFNGCTMELRQAFELIEWLIYKSYKSEMNIELNESIITFENVRRLTKLENKKYTLLIKAFKSYLKTVPIVPVDIPFELAFLN